MLRILAKKLVLATLLVSSLTLTACGGGGGSSTPNTTTTITYTGSKVLAQLSENNAATLANAAQTATSTSRNITDSTASRQGTSSDNTNDMPPVQYILARQAIDIGLNSRYQARTQTASEGCYISGSVSGSETTDDNTGLITQISVTFNQCNNGDGVVLHGSLSLSLSNHDAFGRAGNITLTTSNLSMVANGTTITLAGTLALNVTYNDNTNDVSFSMISNMVMETGDIQLLEETLNQTLTVHADESASNGAISGKICHSTEGCVTFETITPFTFDYWGDACTGEMILHGDNSKLQIIATSCGNYQINLDEDGDGIFETTDLQNQSTSGSASTPG